VRRFHDVSDEPPRNKLTREERDELIQRITTDVLFERFWSTPRSHKLTWFVRQSTLSRFLEQTLPVIVQVLGTLNRWIHPHYDLYFALVTFQVIDHRMGAVFDAAWRSDPVATLIVLHSVTDPTHLTNVSFLTRMFAACLDVVDDPTTTTGGACWCLRHTLIMTLRWTKTHNASCFCLHDAKRMLLDKLLVHAIQRGVCDENAVVMTLCRSAALKWHMMPLFRMLCRRRPPRRHPTWASAMTDARTEWEATVRDTRTLHAILALEPKALVVDDLARRWEELCETLARAVDEGTIDLTSVDDLQCPISLQLPRCPTLCDDGFVYDYDVVAELIRSTRKSPMTRAPLMIVGTAREHVRRIDALLARTRSASSARATEDAKAPPAHVGTKRARDRE
jgi:hypothetical protein